jgi:hypothetical protein
MGNSCKKCDCDCTTDGGSVDTPMGKAKCGKMKCILGCCESVPEEPAVDIASRVEGGVVQAHLRELMFTAFQTNKRLLPVHVLLSGDFSAAEGIEIEIRPSKTQNDELPTGPVKL